DEAHRSVDESCAADTTLDVCRAGLACLGRGRRTRYIAAGGTGRRGAARRGARRAEPADLGLRGGRTGRNALRRAVGRLSGPVRLPGGARRGTDADRVRGELRPREAGGRLFGRVRRPAGSLPGGRRGGAEAGDGWRPGAWLR